VTNALRKPPQVKQYGGDPHDGRAFGVRSWSNPSTKSLTSHNCESQRDGGPGVTVARTGVELVVGVAQPNITVGALAADNGAHVLLT
jgi:hypothetical protein